MTHPSPPGDMKNCPFCGNDAILHERSYGDGRTIYYVQCNTFKPGWCGAVVAEKPEARGPFRSAEEAIDAWNRRAQPASAGTERVGSCIAHPDGCSGQSTRCVRPSRQGRDTETVEACAKIADRYAVGAGENAVGGMAVKIAKAIRALASPAKGDGK